MRYSLYRNNGLEKMRRVGLAFIIVLCIGWIIPVTLQGQTANFVQYTMYSDQGGGDGEYIRNLKYNNGPAWGISFFTGYKQRMTLRGGKLGIGTDNPKKVLHLKSSQPVIKMSYGTSHDWNIRGGAEFIIQKSQTILNTEVVNNVIVIPRETRNVGIGISPVVKLDVAGNVEAWHGLIDPGYNAVEIGHDGSNGYISELANGSAASEIRNLEFRTGGTTRMSMRTDGNVGVGTTTPTEKLEVIGNIKAEEFQLKNFSHGNVQYRTTSASTIMTGTYNTNMGADAGLSITSGVGNSNLGFEAGKGITTGSNNTNIGYSTGYITYTGSNNVHIGANAGAGLTYENGNVVIGAQAGGVPDLSYSVLIGYNAAKTFDGTDIAQRIALPSGNNRSIFVVNNQANIKHPLLFGYFAETPDHNDPSIVPSVRAQLGINTCELIDSCALTVKGAVHIGPNSTTPFRFDHRAQPQNYLLWVQRGVVSESYAVRSVGEWNASWPDYVFDEEYNLPDLKYVKEFIRQNKHLPGVMSRKEVEANNGYSLVELDKQMLEKIEEITLYTIRQTDTLDSLQLQADKLMQELQKLKTTSK